MTHFKCCTLIVSPERLKPESSNFVHKWVISSVSFEMLNYPVDVCMGMGIPIPMGFAWDSHGNGSSFGIVVLMGMGMGMGMGIVLMGMGIAYFIGEK